jgi:hypothetical protein
LVELRARREQRKQNRTSARVLASGVLTVGAVLASGDPAAAMNFPVTNTGDSGAGSLRDAITQANALAGADDITFTIPPASTISLLTALPSITDPLTITGPGASNLTVRRDPAAAVNFRIFDITITAVPAVTITGVTITGGNPAGDGGGINVAGAAALTVTVQDAVITGNVTTGANQGAGIQVGTGTSLTVQRTVISGNTSANDGGGIYLFNTNTLILEDSTISGNTATGLGGGLYQFGASPVTIRGTTFSGNNATPATGRGGAMFLAGGTTGAATPVILVENSTVSGNTAGDDGGGILKNVAGGSLTITHSTITANTASNAAAGSGGGGIFTLVSAAFTPTLRNTIVSGNTNVNGPDILTTGTGSVNANFCAIGDATGWTPSGTSGNNLPFGTNLQLGPLQNNGGPTQTHEPGPNTPCVNAGDPAFVPPPNFDQRGAGFARVVGGQLDIGGVERNPVPVEAQEITVE